METQLVSDQHQPQLKLDSNFQAELDQIPQRVQNGIDEITRQISAESTIFSKTSSSDWAAKIEAKRIKVHYDTMMFLADIFGAYRKAPIALRANKEFGLIIPEEIVYKGNRNHIVLYRTALQAEWKKRITYMQ